MKTNIYIIIAILVAFKSNLFAIEKDSISFHNNLGQEITIDSILKTTVDKKFFFFGELHGQQPAHQVELQLIKALYEKHGDNLVVGMEMFEADVQPIINEYFNGLINQRSFETEARIWNNYQNDYKPVVEFAKENQIPLVATNIPRRYANSVYHQGVAVLEEMPKQTKKNYFPKAKFKVTDNSQLYKQLAEMAAGHNTENLVASQALKDATMARFILENTKKKTKFLHLHGSFHSLYREGILNYMSQNQREQSVVIQTVKSDSNNTESISYADADFTLVIHSTIEK